jgi:hypothetical protein
MTHTEDELVDEVVTGKMSWKEFIYRLLFTKDDALDLTQIIFLINVFYFFIVFGLAGFGIMKITVAAWSVFATIFVTLSIAGTATNVATLIANSKSIGDVSGGIAQSDTDNNRPE